MEQARAFADIDYQTRSGSWSRERRVVGRAEALCGKESPRHVVTSLTEKDWDARALYEVSAETMAANQLRVYLAGMEYVLVSALRRSRWAGTEMARAKAVMIRSRLLKVGAQVKVTARRVRVHLSEAFPLQEVLWHAAARLHC